MREMSHHLEMAYHVGGLTSRVQRLEEAAVDMRADTRAARAEIEKLKSWGQRVTILLTLWTAGTSAHLGSEQLSELLAQLIKAVLVK